MTVDVAQVVGIAVAAIALLLRLPLVVVLTVAYRDRGLSRAE